MQEQATLLINKQTLPFLNISLYLNDIKPIQSLVIENISDVDSDSLEVKITADLACIEPFSYHVSFVPAKKEVKIPLENLQVNRDFLNKLSETEKANIIIEVVAHETVLIKEVVTIHVHPLEHFGGFHILPELIAAYITPNHPYIYRIKRKAIDVLEKQGLKTAFEGYQNNDPERVLQMMSAIYTAIQSEEIVYSSLPPGYEETGQRLRLLNTIQQEKFGNCIDLSLLFAGCLEAVNLNPVLIIVRGHAFVGCWLQDDKFPEVINDDKTAVTKRLSKGIRELAAVEATSVCKGNKIRFSDAVHAGEAQLVQKEDFLISIDIKRARTLRIRPLPLLTNSTGTQLDEEALEQTVTAAMEKQFEIGTIYQDELLQGKQPKTKQKIWERKLLDLSLRNNLLNLHFTRNMLQLVDIDISHLEDTLWEGKSFSILPSANAEFLKRYNLFAPPLHHSAPLYQFANDELKHHRLLTHYHQQDLDNILVYIHKNAKQAIEENGSSTLYLAVGLLKWFDRRTPEQARYAPILLIPVELSRRSVNSKFTLKSREEETMINITLVEFLRQEYELNLSALEQLPTDDKGVDVAKVMGILRRAVMQLKGWDVEEQLVLGNFSFSKLILWKDIVVHQEDLLKSDMVRSLIDGKLAFNEHDVSNTIDDFDRISAQSVVLPIAADVSQMEAVIAAQKGQSFILHGPPGTGKSQTITNIIADALYCGKRVLFVAAKKAALDVVHRRLEQIGLAPFTLELHSNKSKKSDVLAQMAQSLETAKVARTADFEQEAQRLDVAKKAISDYVNVLHEKQLIGWSLYESITALENYEQQNFPKNFIPEAVLQNLNAGLWQQWTDWLPQFHSIASVIVHPAENPLVAFSLLQYSPSVHEDIAVQTEKLLSLLHDAASKSESLSNALHFPFSIQAKNEWEQFVQVAAAFGTLDGIPLLFIKYLSDQENYSVYKEWRKEFHNYIQLTNELNTLPDTPKEFVQYLSEEKNYDVYLNWSSTFKEYMQLRGKLDKLPGVPPDFVNYLSNRAHYTILGEWCNVFLRYQSVVNNILKDYNHTILTANIEALAIEWKQAQQKWFLPKWLQSRKIKKQLSVFRNTAFSNHNQVEQLFLLNKTLQEVKATLQQHHFIEVRNALRHLYKEEQTDVPNIIAKSELVQDLNNQIDAMKQLLQQSVFTEVQKTLSSLYKNEQTDVAAIDSKALLVQDLNNKLQEKKNLLQQRQFAPVQHALTNLFKDEQTDLVDIGNKARLVQEISNLTNFWTQNALGKWVQLWQGNGVSTDEVIQSNLSAIAEFTQTSSALSEQIKKYETLTGIQFHQTENWHSETFEQLQKIQTQLPNLKKWMNYVQLRKQGESLQLQWMINAYEKNYCSTAHLPDYFQFTVNASIAQKVISQHETLSLFNAGLFESKIQQYKKIAKDFQQLTIQELRVKLAAQLPNTTTEAMQSSEIGILQRAIKNRGRGLSIRKLFDQIPTLLPRIAPCMLMSPISVAQYFDVSKKHFDILIFDEASQLPTCEAVSALARAKQFVIVGDPKQMPPTSFFSTTKLDEENMDVEDLESILDDCLSLSVPSKYLLRHYRSKHESLIAFSNVNYYENKLLTFPSSDDLNRKVKYHQVKGFYDKGKTRTNKFEADEIVEFIKVHYNDSQKRKLSLGVVTFSQTQQNLIEDKLQKLFLSDPKLEEYAGESEEPLFIKNLENVQGDERDIILFSVCYAPDEEGKMSMNFGPLNRDGGWRRLNVAVTRARYEMHLFASLQTDQIDLSRTSAEGVAGLKAFLNFAEKGHLSVRPEDLQQALNKRHLSAAISKKIQEMGFEVKCNIGTSGFKVDIGIVHPDKPQQYILGIVLDGYYYYHAKTTNDREMVMPSVLKTLGWNIHRIWTMDWFENSNTIIESIVEQVKQLQTQPEVKDQIIEMAIVTPSFEPIQVLPDEIVNRSHTSKQKPYVVASLTSVSFANSETILEFQNRNTIKQQIQSLLDTEAPISKSLLYKKVLQAWNTSRAGARLDKHLEGIIKEMNLVETMHHQPFYWNNNHTLDYYRSNDIEKRNMEDIAPEEVIVALEEVVTNNLSIEEDELLRYLARSFGFAKVGKQIDTLLRYTIDVAVKQQKVKRDNDRIKVAVA